jgi:hypothetical protein
VESFVEICRFFLFQQLAQAQTAKDIQISIIRKEADIFILEVSDTSSEEINARRKSVVVLKENLKVSLKV